MTPLASNSFDHELGRFCLLKAFDRLPVIEK